MVNQICPICDSKVIKNLTRQKQYLWQVCDYCNFVFLDINLPNEDINDVESSEQGDAYIKIYGNKYKAKMRRSMRRARTIKRLMKGLRILDIGCNLGYFVEACRVLGLESIGLEVNPIVVKQAKSMFPLCHFTCGFLGDTDIGKEKFDAIYTSEVIEHVEDVNDFMKNISSKLVSGGILYLTTPDIKGFIPKHTDGEWKKLHAPNHRLYFSKVNMRVFLEKHGFKDVKFKINWNFKPGIKLSAIKI